MKKSKAAFVIVFCLSMCLMASAAWAHALWLTCPKAKAGDKLTMEFVLGHSFPVDQLAEPDAMAEAYVVGPNGKIKAAPGSDKKFVTAKPLAAGSYVAAGATKAKFFTKSPAGYVPKTKDQVPEAIKCFRSYKFAKAIVNLGGKAGDVSKPVGQDLEIVPLANPAGVKVGGELPVKVLLAGKPLAKEAVYATFAGFSKGHAMAFYDKTNKDGVVKVKVWHSGLWMVKVGFKKPYKDPAKCDVVSKGSVLTFEIK
jgi:uncharacterized GH25 family protein